jgi:hypothetical protein
VETPTALFVAVGAVIVAAGVAALVGLFASEHLGYREAKSRGRVAALVGLGAVGVLTAVTGSLFQGYTVRIGGSTGAAPAADGGSTALAAADLPRADGGTVGGFAFPLGALLMLAVLAAVFLFAARRLRAPIGVGVPAACWLAVVALFMYGGEGDVILAATAPAQVYFFGGLILATAFFVPAYQWQLTDRLAPKR